MKRSFEERLRRLEVVFRPKEVLPPLLIRVQTEGVDGKVSQTAISGGPLGAKGRPLFSFKPGEPAEAEAAAYIANAKAHILVIHLIEKTPRAVLPQQGECFPGGAGSTIGGGGDEPVGVDAERLQDELLGLKGRKLDLLLGLLKEGRTN